MQCYGKVMYSKRGAERRAERLRKLTGVRFYVYQCPRCEAWHLTKRSQEPASGFPSRKSTEPERP